MVAEEQPNARGDVPAGSQRDDRRAREIETGPEDQRTEHQAKRAISGPKSSLPTHLVKRPGGRTLDTGHETVSKRQGITVFRSPLGQCLPRSTRGDSADVAVPPRLAA